MVGKNDLGADNLLTLNGDHYFVDDKGEFEVRSEVKSVAVMPQRPHELRYSLVLLDSKNERAVCFDNAHSVSQGSGPGKKRAKQDDHKHIGDRVIPYKFKDALTLIEDFWAEVDKHIQQHF